MKIENVTNFQPPTLILREEETQDGNFYISQVTWSASAFCAKNSKEYIGKHDELIINNFKFHNAHVTLMPNTNIDLDKECNYVVLFESCIKI